jgi:glycosyltransferase involved in cell wall biosynthesis
MNLHARISVAMCTFNGELFLGEQLESLLAQTRVPDEIVICDDASEDGTVALIQRYAERLPIRLVSNGQRLGVAQNFSNAIAECTGDFIFLADQDDIWEANKVEEVVRIFFGVDRPGLVFSDAILIDDHSRLLATSLWQANGFSAARKEKFANGNALRHLLRSNIVTGATAAFRAELKPAILPVPPNWMHDYWLATVIAAISKIHCEPTPLTRYRLHSRQQVGIRRNALDKLKSLMLRKVDLESECEKYCELRKRVDLYCGGQTSHSDALTLIDQKLTHIALRKEIALHTGSSSSKIIKEVVSGNYARYSYGWIDVVRDIYRAARA